MRWKRVVWAGWLAPALGGCHTTGPAAAPELPSGGLVAHTQAAIEHRIRADAREAWKAVRAEYPRRAFTAEFHDGFLDGYSDHLDRGGDGTPPPTPPVRYTRHARYFTPEGHVLLRDYFLGFKYGADVAAATGQRQFLTVPVLVPDGGPPDVLVDAIPAPLPIAPAIPAPQPTPAPATPTPPSDRPLSQPLSPPAPQPLPPPTAEPPRPTDRSGYHPPNWDRNRARPKAAPAQATRPVAPPDLRATGTKFGPVGTPLPVTAPAAEPEPVAIPVSLPVPRLPEPPAAVPTLPAHVPTPPVTDDLPVLPPVHDLPPPLPVVHPEPTR
jgi:hypothetical protein